MEGRHRVVWRYIVVVLLTMLVLAASVTQAQGEVSGNDPGAATADEMDNPNEMLAPAAAEADVAEPQAAAGGPYYAVVPAAAFSSDGSIPDGFLYNFGNGYLCGLADSGVCLAAPVTLTPGTTVNAFEVTFNDQNATLSEYFELSRVSLLTGVRTVMASVATPAGTTAGVTVATDSTISYGDVTNEYAYQITTCVRSDIYVYGARVGHSARTYLPAVSK